MLCAVDHRTTLVKMKQEQGSGVVTGALSVVQVNRCVE